MNVKVAGAGLEFVRHASDRRATAGSAHANSATQTANNFHGSSQAIGFKELDIECSMLIVPAVIQRFTILILIIYIVIFYMSRNFQLIFDLENTDYMGGRNLRGERPLTTMKLDDALEICEPFSQNS